MKTYMVRSSKIYSHTSIKKKVEGYGCNAYLEQSVHLKQSVITVYIFYDANVNVYYVPLIASYLKCDVIVRYIWLS